MFQYPIPAKTEDKETKKTAKQLRLPLQNTCQFILLNLLT